MLKLKVPRVDVSLKFIAVFLTLYLSATPIAVFFYIRWSIIAFIVFAIAFFLTGRFLAKRKSMLFYIMASALFLLTCILTKDNDLGHYVGRIMNLTTAFFFCQIITKNDFEYCFGKIMCWLSAFSLIIYVFFNIFPSAVWSLPMIVIGSGNTAKRLATVAYLHYFNINGSHEVMGEAWAGAEVVRNAGMFSEPGMYQVFLNLAIMIYIIKLKNEENSDIQKEYLLRIALLGVTICTTVSTTGIVVFICLLLSLLFSGKSRAAISKAYHKYTILKLLMPVVFIGFIVGIIIVAPTVFGKFSPNAVNYGSYVTRSTNTVKDINAWLLSPLWGVGISNYEAFFSGTENGITCALACYGFPIVLIAIFAVYCYIKKSCRGNAWLYFVSLLLSLSTQNIFFTLFMYIIYYYGLDKAENVI